VKVRLAIDHHPPFEDGVYVVIPHEFFEVAREGGSPPPGHLRRTVGYCVELPWTHWFGVAVQYTKQLRGLVDIRASGVSALGQWGCARFTLRSATARRGSLASRRDGRAPLGPVLHGLARRPARPRLAGYAETLAQRPSRLMIDPQHAEPTAGPSFVHDEDKNALLRSTKTLLNIHRAGADALEWPRRGAACLTWPRWPVGKPAPAYRCRAYSWCA
jgi:hypothetical protein